MQPLNSTSMLEGCKSEFSFWFVMQTWGHCTNDYEEVLKWQVKQKGGTVYITEGLSAPCQNFYADVCNSVETTEKAGQRAREEDRERWSNDPWIEEQPPRA